MKNFMWLLLVLMSFAAVCNGQTAPTSKEATPANFTAPVAECAGGSVNTQVAADCAKRDTARLFFAAGQPEVGLRILCHTLAAGDAFHETPGGDGTKACLRAVGLPDLSAK